MKASVSVLLHAGGLQNSFELF